MNLDISCIYKITSPSGRIYIGQTHNYRKRINHYRRLLCKKQYMLYNSFKKYGFENHVFEILKECSTSELNNYERYYQELFDCVKSGLNLCLVRDNDRSGSMNDSTKKKLSLANSGINNGMYGKKTPESVKILQREKLSGSKNYLSKLVLNTETGIYYDCLTEAARSANILKGTLWHSIIKNKKKNTKFIYA